MRIDIFKKLFNTRLMVSIAPIYISQKYIDELRCYIRQYLLEFDIEPIEELIGQMDCLMDNDRELLFSESFLLYNVLEFKNLKNQQRKQFNDVLRISLILSDYEENLISQKI